MLKGNLSSFSLGEIFQSLAINKHTGTLTLQGAGVQKHIYFEDGDIRFFSHGKPTTPRIGEMLVRSGRLAEEDVQSALAESKESGKLLGQILVEGGKISEDDITAVLKMKVCEEIYELFAWDSGEFEFHLGSCSDEVFDALQRSVQIHVSTNGVIMEGLRRLDEWQRIHTRIRTENEFFIAAPEAASSADDPDRREILQLLDGKSNIGDISRSYPGAKFELFKTIYDLLEEGAARPLTAKELEIDADAYAEEREYPEAAACLRFATELEPEAAELFTKLGDMLAQFYQEKEAHRCFLRALELHVAAEDWDGAGRAAERLPANADLEIDEIERILETFIHLKLIKKALWAGQQLATRLQKEGETQHAAEVLDRLVAVDPNDLNLRVQIAKLLAQVGETDRATEYYEEVASTLESQKKIKDQVKILRIVSELHPNRSDLKQKIASLVSLQEKLEKRRKQRMTAAGIGAILLVTGAITPIIYEVKARELFEHAGRLEAMSLGGGDFTEVRAAYEAVLQGYGLSTKADDAKLALERLASIATGLDKTIQAQKEGRIKEREEQRKELEASIETLLAEARAAEEALDMDRAHAIYRKAHEIGREILVVHKLPLPVLIESSPKGADVTIKESSIGKTPCVYHYRQDETVTIRLERAGCEAVEKEVTLLEQKRLQFRLPRRPVQEVVLPSTFTQSPQSGAGNLFLFPSRDGHVYSYAPDTREILWKKKVGRFGDLVSNLTVANGYAYVGTVDNAFLAFHVRTGQPKWPARPIRGPVVAAPAISKNDQWAAVANVFGEVFLLDNRTGRSVDRFATENEVTAKPVFVGDYLLVGSRDRYIYGYSLSQRKVVFINELTGEARVDPARFRSDAIFATTDGRVHRLDPSRRGSIWGVRVASERVVAVATSEESGSRDSPPTDDKARQDFIFVALDSGAVLALDPETGGVEHRWEISDSEPGGMRFAGGTLFVGYTNGYLAAWNAERGELAWGWQADASISVPPIVIDGHLYVACNSGTVQVLEID